MVLLEMRSTLIGPGLPCPVTLLFNRPVRGVLPKFIRTSMVLNNDTNYQTTTIRRQPYSNLNVDPYKISNFYIEDQL